MKMCFTSCVADFPVGSHDEDVPGPRQCEHVMALSARVRKPSPAERTLLTCKTTMKMGRIVRLVGQPPTTTFMKMRVLLRKKSGFSRNRDQKMSK